MVIFTPGVLEPGGAAKHSMLVADGLAGLGNRVTVISREANASLPRVWRAASGYRVVTLPSPGSARVGAWLYLTVAPLVGMLVGGRRPRFVAMQLSLPTLVGCLCAVVRGAPVAVFSFSSGAGSEAALYADSRFRRLRLWLLRRASVLVGQTEESAAELSELAPGSRVEVIPSPLELPEQAPRAFEYTVRRVLRTTDRG